MGGIGGLLGMGGGASGSGFAAPTGNTPQLNTAYDQTQAGIQQQQRFVDQLNTQNGLGNQGQVWRQQQDLANQLQGVANGTGPNPAMAALNQQTGKNISNQAALMAGQRGASANTGLMARQAANQGANLQQQAVGQGATMQAQQSLAAMQQLQGQQANMGNLANTQVNQQQAGLSALNQNSLQQQANPMGLQSNINSANAQLAGASQGAQGNMMGNLMGGIGAVGGLFGGGKGVNINGAGSGGAANMVTEGGGQYDPSIFEGGVDALAQGGQVHRMAEGGQLDTNALSNNASQPQLKELDTPKIDGPSSKVGQMFNTYESGPKAAPAKGGGGDPLGGMGNMMQTGMQGLMKWGEHEAMPYISDFFSGLGAGAAGIATTAGPTMAGGALDAGAVAAPAVAAGAVEVAPVALAAAKGGKVPALLSPGERYLSPEKAKAAKDGKVDPIKAGKLVPGKPKVGGAKNDYANDTVKASLEEGGLVLPRSVTESKNPQWAAHKFVQAHMMARGGMIPKAPKKKK